MTDRVLGFSINLGIFLLLTFLELRRARKVRVGWHYLLWFLNNMIWSLYAIAGTYGGFYSPESGRIWFTAQWLQFLITFIIERYIFIMPKGVIFSSG